MIVPDTGFWLALANTPIMPKKPPNLYKNMAISQWT